MNKHKSLIIGIVVFLIFLGVLFYTLTIIFSESLYTSRGTFSYYVTIPREIRTFPEIGIIGEPKFFYGCGDGPKPPIQEIRYRSNASTAAILEEADSYLRSQGYALSNKNSETEFCDEGIIYDKNHSIIEVCITSDNGSKNQVQISKFF